MSLALDGWTSSNKFVITSVMAYDMDQNCTLGEVQPAFDEGESLFFSYFECYIRMVGQGSTYRMKASHTYEGGSGLFWVYRRLFTRNHH